MSKRFADKVVVVTGAAGGIGRATVARLAREGAKIVATDLEGTSLDETVKVAEEAGAAIVTATHDVTCWDDWQRVMGEATSRFGGVDVLVNNAGIEGPIGALEEASEEGFDRVLAVNVKGVFLGLKAVIPELRKRGGGAIVNLSSVAGVIGDPAIGPYVATKHAVIGLTKSVGNGYAAEGIRANAVCPAPIDTRMMDALETALAPGEEASMRALVEERIPFGRYGTADEVAAVIAFLGSDDASYVTGSIYTVDGGMTNY